MKTYKINVTQSTATGKGQSETTLVYIARWVDSDVIIASTNIERKMKSVPEDAYEVVAVAEITHPWLMLGDAEEIKSCFYALAIQAAREAGDLEENDYGTKFWTGK